MSIASEITRLQNAKSSIKSSIEAKGVTVPSSAKLDDYSDYVDQIQTGGGSSEERITKLIRNQLTSLIASDFTGGTTGTSYSVSQYTFKSKTSITSVTFPQTMYEIGAYAFASCTGLTSFTAPVCTNLFENNALVGCTNLQTINLSNLQTPVALRGLTWFEVTPNSVPYSWDGFTHLTSVTFPQTVKDSFYGSWNKYGLANTTNLTSVTLPSTENAITRNDAIGYLYNSGISSAYLGDGVIYIAESMFQNCQNLTSVSLPSGLVNIGTNAFKDCSLLTSLTFRGTMAQFATVTLNSGWRRNTQISVIHCTDGDYSIPMIEDLYWSNYVISDYEWIDNGTYTVNGGKVWWNGETIQYQNYTYNPTTGNWTENRSNGKLDTWYYNGNWYCVSGINQVAKYDATASHAGTTDVWTTLNVHTPSSQGNNVAAINGDIYYITSGKGYKWLGESTGFDSAPTFTLANSGLDAWNIWSPDGQHYFLTGDTTSAYQKKNYLWDATNETFVAWNDTNLYCQGMGFFKYENKLYYIHNNSNKVYDVNIDYNAQTITLTQTSDFNNVASTSNGPDRFWDENGTRSLNAVGLRPRN